MHATIMVFDLYGSVVRLPPGPIAHRGLVGLHGPLPHVPDQVLPEGRFHGEREVVAMELMGVAVFPWLQSSVFGD